MPTLAILNRRQGLGRYSVAPRRTGRARRASRAECEFNGAGAADEYGISDTSRGQERAAGGGSRNRLGGYVTWMTAHSGGNAGTTSSLTSSAESDPHFGPAFAGRTRWRRDRRCRSPCSTVLD